MSNLLLWRDFFISEQAWKCLLGNFEIVATTIFAFLFFKEIISIRLFFAVILITLSGMILTFEGVESLQFSYGSAFVLLATVCWGFENNCTRKISSKNTFEIVIIKGIFSGLGALIIALMSGENMPKIFYMLCVMSLGFVAYGLSIFFYVKAQNVIGAAKTSAYYSVAPFVGALMSFMFLNEKISEKYLLALVIMAVGSILVVIDTLILSHIHEHEHFIDNTHKFSHSHAHNHYISLKNHRHFHKEMFNLENQ
ncbi:MAG: DMT family transporter [Synergistaceae bacterium]|nr:DMT family transporter [Synergistaceae bacterium]